MIEISARELFMSDCEIYVEDFSRGNNRVAICRLDSKSKKKLNNSFQFVFHVFLNFMRHWAF